MGGFPTPIFGSTPKSAIDRLLAKRNTLPETISIASLHLKHGMEYKPPFLLGAFRPIFRGEVLVSGRVVPFGFEKTKRVLKTKQGYINRFSEHDGQTDESSPSLYTYKFIKLFLKIGYTEAILAPFEMI